MTKTETEKTEKTETKKKEKEKEKPAPKEVAKSEVAPKSDASKSAASGKGNAGYAAVFAQWEFVPTEEGPIKIDPAKLIVIFDVRTTAQPIDEFVKQCTGGINTPVKIMLMKYLGPDGDYLVSPDPKTRVALKRGETYYVIDYGRRRTRASLKLGFKEIPAEIKNYKTWQEAVADAYVENNARTDMTTWDRASHIKNLRDGGRTQDAIAEELKLASGTISQYLGVFDLPEPVQKMIGNDELSVTAVRILRPLRAYDADEVTAFAQRAVDKGWNEKELQEAAKLFVEKHATEGPAQGKKAKKVSRVVDYDTAAVSFLSVKKIRPLLNFAATKLKMVRSKVVDETPEAQAKHAKKVGKAEGYLEGLMAASGLKDAPPEAFVVEEEEKE